MKFAVTGGAGFIGRYVCEEASLRGHAVTVVDRSKGLDLTDVAAVRAHLKDRHVDHVIHLAGVLGTSELFEPERAHEAFKINIGATYDLLRACVDLGCGYTAITMPAVWNNVYRATKQCASILASAFHDHYQLPVSHVIAFDTYGFGQKIGPIRKVIPWWSWLAWQGRPLPIYGDGKQIIDLVWAGDVARMLVDAAAYGDDDWFECGPGGLTGAEVSLTANVVATWVNRITENLAGVEHVPMRPGEGATRGAHSQHRGCDRLGWTPHFRLDRFEETVQSYEAAAVRHAYAATASRP